MAKLFDKFIGIMGLSEDDEEDFEMEENLEEERRGSKYRNVPSKELQEKELLQNHFSRDSIRESTSKRKSASVVSIHTQKQVRVIVVEPVSFEEAQGIAEHLKARKSVILNLEKTDSDLAQRIVDFISGTTYALGGNMQKVGNGIFLFVPNNVDISGEMGFSSGDKEFSWSNMNQ